MDFSRPPLSRDLDALLPGAVRIDLVRVPSLYVIDDGARVIYAGRTSNWLQRLERHQRGVIGPPDMATEAMLSALVIPCRMSLTLRERALIAWLRPTHNAPVALDARMRRVLDNWLNKQ